MPVDAGDHRLVHAAAVPGGRRTRRRRSLRRRRRPPAAALRSQPAQKNCRPRSAAWRRAGRGRRGTPRTPRPSPVVARSMALAFGRSSVTSRTAPSGGCGPARSRPPRSSPPLPIHQRVARPRPVRRDDQRVDPQRHHLRPARSAPAPRPGSTTSTTWSRSAGRRAAVAGEQRGAAQAEQRPPYLGAVGREGAGGRRCVPARSVISRARSATFPLARGLEAPDCRGPRRQPRASIRDATAWLEMLDLRVERGDRRVGPRPRRQTSARRRAVALEQRSDLGETEAADHMGEIHRHLAGEGCSAAMNRVGARRSAISTSNTAATGAGIHRLARRGPAYCHRS